MPSAVLALRVTSETTAGDIHDAFVADLERHVD